MAPVDTLRKLRRSRLCRPRNSVSRSSQCRVSTLLMWGIFALSFMMCSVLLEARRAHHPLLERQHFAVRQRVVAERPVFGGKLLLLAERRFVLCGESLVGQSE